MAPFRTTSLNCRILGDPEVDAIFPDVGLSDPFWDLHADYFV